MIFILEAQIKKYLRLSKNVVPFQKEPSETLMQLIPGLIKEIKALAGMNKLTETNIKANSSIILKCY
jgi:uncharacterized protein YehS (DUF1456 family)